MIKNKKNTGSAALFQEEQKGKSAIDGGVCKVSGGSERIVQRRSKRRC